MGISKCLYACATASLDPDDLYIEFLRRHLIREASNFSKDK